MEPLPGTYALVLEAGTAREIQIGRLGRLHLAPGWYVYVGSAPGHSPVCRHILPMS